MLPNIPDRTYAKWLSLLDFRSVPNTVSLRNRATNGLSKQSVNESVNLWMPAARHRPGLLPAGVELWLLLADSSHSA